MSNFTSSSIFSKVKSAITSSCMNCDRHGATKQIGKLGFAPRHILLDSDDIRLVAPAFGLYGDYVLAALRIDSHVQFVRLDMSDAARRRPEVIL